MAQEDIKALQLRLNQALHVPDDARAENAAINPQGFSVFDKRQLEHALHDASEFMEIANKSTERPLGAVLDAVEVKLQDNVNDNEAVRHGLMVFLTHHPIAQASGLKITSLASRAPSLTVPVHSQTPAPDGEDTEVALNYFREDVNLNEHHEHWHIVYPSGGIPNPRNPSQMIPKDRQGELFYWMHQQMIGRYNAERLSNGFEKVKAIVNYSDPLESDVPDANLRYRGKAFSPRPKGTTMRDLGHQGQKDHYPLAQLEQWRERLIEACKSGKWNDGTPVTADSLGSTLEANINVKDRRYYGSLHNMGHVIIAYLSNPENWQSPDTTPGLMYETRTAVRDPVFWRWHSHIDDLFYLWQENQPVLTFQDAPPVTFRKAGAPSGSPDIITVFEDVIAAAGVNISDAAAVEAWGEQVFGGAAWDSPPNPQFATDVFETEMRSRSFQNIGDDGATEEIKYLFPREYAYFIRVSNPTDQEQKITLRVNLAPSSEAENRRAWFEMDKFHVTIPAKTNKVIFRRCDQSSVIRKPAQKTVEEMDDRRDEDDGLDRTGDQYCDCGWPFNLLIPKGTPEGMPFKLSVLATDWNLDHVPSNTGCGSMSFCGAKEKYPDSREMGYPFIRRFEKSITETINDVPSWAVKDVVIKHVSGGFTSGNVQPIATPVSAPAPNPAPVANQDETSREIDFSASPATPPTATSSMSETTETLPNGDIVTIVTETLPSGVKKVTKTTKKKVPKGTPGPWDKTKPGTTTTTSVDEQGRKVVTTETVDDKGVRKITRQVFPKE